MTKPQDKPDFPCLFPEGFVKEIPEELPPLCPKLHRIILKDPTKLIKTPVFKCPDALLGRFKDWIDKRMAAGILKRERAPGGGSMFVQAKPDGRIRSLVELQSRNQNTEADHSQIPNQQTILCNDPTIGSYNDYHLSPNGIPSGR